METITKIDENTIEVETSTTLTNTYKKEWLIKEKARIEDLLRNFD